MSSSAELFERACQHHQANRLEDAEALYRQILQDDPQHAEALCYLGTLCQATGRLDEAAANLWRAVERVADYGTALNHLAMVLAQQGKLEEAAAWLNRLLLGQPADADGWNNLAQVRLRQGRLDDAIDCYRRAVQCSPDMTSARAGLDKALQQKAMLAGAGFDAAGPVQQNVGTYIAQGKFLGGQSRFAEAAASFRLALQQQPDCAEAHVYLGLALQEQGQFAEAVANYARALQIESHRVDAFANMGRLGNLRKAAGDLHGAIGCYQQVLRFRPNHADTHHNLGNAFFTLERFEDAVPCYREVIRLKPDHYWAYNNLGSALQNLGRLEEAVACYQQALRLETGHAETHANLGSALLVQGQVDEAMVSFREAVRLDPTSVLALNNLAAGFLGQARLDEALATYDEVLRLAPNFGVAHVNRGLVLLLQGDFRRGWNEYEWRWHAAGSNVPSFSQPRWDGTPLAGRTILLYSEQGLGDAIQFLRYVPLVKRLGGRVVVQCPPTLLPLARSCAGTDLALPCGAPPPAFDVQAPLMSLPGIMGTSLATIPAEVPYLTPDAARVEWWHKELAAEKRLKVGIVWKGSSTHKNDRQRSAPLAEFAPLAQVPGVALYSLQVEEGTEQLASADFPIADLGSKSTSMEILAAILMNLDLLISVDTAPVHLAGALGRPVWIALPFMPDWRWMLGRADSPWYPTARLFRQPRAGDWKSVFEQITIELRRLPSGGHSAGTA